jgi:hypothetical protein
MREFVLDRLNGPKSPPPQIVHKILSKILTGIVINLQTVACVSHRILGDINKLIGPPCGQLKVDIHSQHISSIDFDVARPFRLHVS